MCNPQPVQKAHPGARRKAVITLFAAVGVFALLLVWGTEWRGEVVAWGVRHGEALVRSPAIAAGCMFVLLLPAVVFALFAYGYGARVKRGRRFPPPGAQVIRDTPIVEGEQAARRGAGLQVLGLLVFALVCGLIYLTWRLFHSLGANHP